jgi:hypothetical protein
MKILNDRFKIPTLFSAAGYIFVLALAAKGIFLFGSQHPSKDELLFVEGIVRQVRLGGQGTSTWFQIESDGGTHRYSSYYGRVWPGMERIRPDDRVEVFAERNKLNKNELITGRQYYIWELIHRNQIIVAYEDVRSLITGKESTLNRYANGVLAASVVFLVIAYTRKVFIGRAK